VSQELRILLHCDRHLAEGQVKTGDAATLTATLDREAFEAELCPVCHKELVQPLLDVLRAVGRKPGGATAAPAPRTEGGKTRARCPVPDCGVTATVLRRHVIAEHGRAAERKYLPAMQRYRCAEAGCARAEPGEECAGVVGLSVHLRNGHNITTKAHDYIRDHNLTPVTE
jgi:hypothetical protein